MRCKLLMRQQLPTKLYLFLIVVFLLPISAESVFADEGKIAFVSNRGEDGDWAIYIMDSDGGNPFKLTEGGTPAWLPNGEKIGFVHDGDIWVIDREGTNRKNITKGRFCKGTLLGRLMVKRLLIGQEWEAFSASRIFT